MDLLRTPDSAFVAVPDFPFEPRFVDLGGPRMAFVETGPANGPVVLCLHGEPTWSFVYRKVLPVLGAAGLRAIAPDLIGFGRSDKPARREDYTYQRHLDWLRAFIEAQHLSGMTLLCQDWGGLLGLRLATELPERFDRIVAANTFLPTGDLPMPKAFFRWREFSQTTPDFDVGGIVAKGCTTPLAASVKAAYDAPFPDDRFKAGARQFPMLVPATSDDPQTEPNRRAWEVLGAWTKPFLTAFSDQDPITRGGDGFMQGLIPGAQGQPHVTLPGGHFLQEDCGEQLGAVVVDFVRRTTQR
ncbi:MAG: haloalkane dehalogenase [Myxococcaceae bacterium]|nr:haloalkane dehalogenase [Myxococcaceae bacterium]